MKSETISIILIILGSIGFLLQFVNALIHQDNRKWYKRITNLGWCVIITSFATIYFGISLIIVSQSEKDTLDGVAKANDTEKQAKIANLQFSLDSSNHTLHSMDSFMRAYCKVSMERDKTGNITYNYNSYSQYAPKTKLCLVKFFTANKPDKSVSRLCNGDYMLLKYRPHNKGKSITIPYMKGKDYVSGFAVFDNTLLNVEFDKETGTFNLLNGFEFGVDQNGEPGYDSINFSFLATLPTKE